MLITYICLIKYLSVCFILSNKNYQKKRELIGQKGAEKVVIFGFGVKKIKIVTLWHPVAPYGTYRKLDYVVFIDYL